MNTWILRAALLATSLGAHAAPYQSVVPAKSSIGFAYKQMGVAMDGRFKQFNAQVQLDPQKPQLAKGSIDIDLNGVDTGSSEADQEVRSKAWFNVAAHPKARFVLQRLRPLGGNQFEAAGTLTLKGQTREVLAPMTLSPQGLLSGSVVIRRADFGIGEGMWAKFDVVANEITVQFKLSLQ